MCHVLQVCVEGCYVCESAVSAHHFFFFGCFAATQLARQLHQECTQAVCSNGVARKRPARRHSRNGPWTHECCFEMNILVRWECI